MVRQREPAQAQSLTWFLMCRVLHAASRISVSYWKPAAAVPLTVGTSGTGALPRGMMRAGDQGISAVFAGCETWFPIGNRLRRSLHRTLFKATSVPDVPCVQVLGYVARGLQCMRKGRLNLFVAPSRRKDSILQLIYPSVGTSGTTPGTSGTDYRHFRNLGLGTSGTDGRHIGNQPLQVSGVPSNA